MNPTDSHIIQLLQAGDKSAMGLIYDKWADPLYGIIFNICKDDGVSKDVLQDTFLKVWQKADTYNPERSKLFTWIYQIARNKAIDAYRKSSNNRAVNIQNAVSIVSNNKGDDVLYHSELNSHISKLEPKYQQVLQALFYEGMTQMEMSENTGIAIGTIKSRLRIALRELRTIYKEPSIIVWIIIMVYGA